LQRFVQIQNYYEKIGSTKIKSIKIQLIFEQKNKIIDVILQAKLHVKSELREVILDHR